MTTIWGEFQSRDAPLEREVVNLDPAVEVGQNCAAMFVDG
jgi:hypothetical protein